MIRQLHIACKTFCKTSFTRLKIISQFEYKIRIIVALFCGLFLLYSFNNYPLRKEEEYFQNILSNFFDFSSIFAGILITYLITKIFHIKEEKLSHKNEIDDISTKLTNFRRICHVLLNSYGIWDESVKKHLDFAHKDLSYFDFYKCRLVESQKYPESITKIKTYFDDKKSPNEIITQFYTALKCLALKELNQGMFLYEHHDIYKINYPLELIQLWHHSDCASTFYLALDHEKRYTDKLFNIEKLHTEFDIKPIYQYLEQIDKRKYSKRQIDNELLLELGEDFQSQYIPRLHFLVSQTSQRLPLIIRVLIWGLAFFIILGVIIPLFCLSVKLKVEQLGFLTYLSVFSVLMTLIIFILFFDVIIKKEVQTYNPNKVFQDFVETIKLK